MMSRIQCLTKADQCERLAANCLDDKDQQVLVATAGHWRTLAGVADDQESRRQEAARPTRRRPKTTL